MTKRIFLLWMFLGVIATPSLQAQDIQVTSSFSKRTATVNEEINLVIRVTGASGNIQAPRLPGYKGFDSFYTGRSSHMSFINGRSSSSVEFSYVLVPKEAGSFLLDPIEMTINGRTFKTNPIQLEIQAGQGSSAPPPPSPYRSTTTPSAPASGSSQPNYQSPPANFNPNDENIFVRAWVDKTTVYPNEQVLLTYSLYTRYDTRYEGFQEEPEVSGFWIEEFPQEREVKRETVRMNGKRYVKADIKRMALFPTTTADYTIQPGTIKVSIRQEPQNSSVFDEFFNDSFFSGGSFFSRRENRLLKPPPIALTVKPFPEKGRPESFQGSSGNFRMQAKVDKREVKQNEPVTMSILIEGEGNIETLNKPQFPELDHFKIYEADTSSELYKSGNVIGGQKSFEIVFIPTKAGNTEIPEIPFSYFNTTSGKYITLKTPVFPLKVEKSDQTFNIPKSVAQQDVFKKEVEVEGRDIRYIHERIPERAWGQLLSLLVLGLAAVDGLLFLILLFGLFRMRQDQIFEKNVGLKRTRFAKSQAETRLKPLRQLMKIETEEGAHRFFEEAEKILTQYLSDKFNLSTYGITRTDLERELEETLGSEDSLFREIIELYQLCDQARFARAKLPKELKEKAMKTLKEAMSRVEKLR